MTRSLTTDDGSFNDLARQFIYGAAGGRCVGCGRSDLTAQHRRARGMGGTGDISIGHPANGVALCGSGTTGSHGWVEKNPVDAELLGWRLAPGTPALGAPWWHRLEGWRAWAEMPDGYPVVVFVDAIGGEVDRLEEREEALRRYLAATERWIKHPVRKASVAR